MATKRRTEEPAGARDDLENEAQRDPRQDPRREAASEDEDPPIDVPLDELDRQLQRDAEDELSESPEDLARRYLEEATEARARPPGRPERVLMPLTEQPLAIDDRED